MGQCRLPCHLKESDIEHLPETSVDADLHGLKPARRCPTNKTHACFGLPSDGNDTEREKRWSQIVATATPHVPKLLALAEEVAGNLQFLEMTVMSKRELHQMFKSRSMVLQRYSPLSSVPAALKAELIQVARADPQASRALGCLVGSAVGDALGAPLEFIDVTDTENRWNRVDEDFKLVGGLNKFHVKPGQWTDDCAMALCMADSLLAHHEFNGSDIRIRFYNWWFRGYNNSFANDTRPPGSVGLGGNVASSLSDMAPHRTPPPFFQSHTEDSGNGSLMRLGPIPVFYSKDPLQAARMSAQSSYTTHPGPIAAAACAFLGYLLARAITMGEGEFAGGNRSFLDGVVREFLQLDLAEARDCAELRRMLKSDEPEGREQCWNWRGKTLALERSFEIRGHQYNGYPSNAGYFGSYCIDGLAMALHSFYNTSNFNDAVRRCVNFLGDADSTASMVGQIAGAFYGIQGIRPELVDRLYQWDDDGEIECRAALLHVARQ
uniref:ADP-ribosylglycohydrolase n=1 Tax=Noctiluca scintillans TaxID=2966 RepID=A0A7S1AMQ4_NOCSC|mmetsp:Transcript_52520/g.139856  ORF Transcript_52520/g.139856 Transcript_52520/m.139856 type:complete len:493 (+) Transcript_52520:88-1566(+)